MSSPIKAYSRVAPKRLFPYIGKRGKTYYAENMVGKVVFASIMDFMRLDMQSLESYEDVMRWLANKGRVDTTHFTSKIYEENGKLTELSLEPVTRFYYVVVVNHVLEVFNANEFKRRFTILH